MQARQHLASAVLKGFLSLCCLQKRTMDESRFKRRSLSSKQTVGAKIIPRITCVVFNHNSLKGFASSC